MYILTNRLRNGGVAGENRRNGTKNDEYKIHTRYPIVTCRQKCCFRVTGFSPCLFEGFTLPEEFRSCHDLDLENVNEPNMEKT
jgi:hypothetical protein